MYLLLKDKGSNQNITLKNTDTNASVVLGKNSFEILNILEKYEHMPASSIALTDNWEMRITTETAEALQNLALKISKPVRRHIQAQQQVVTPEEARKARHKAIDALDVLMGRAKYD